MVMHDEKQVFHVVSLGQRIRKLQDQRHERQKDEQRRRDVVAQFAEQGTTVISQHTFAHDL